MKKKKQIFTYKSPDDVVDNFFKFRAIYEKKVSYESVSTYLNSVYIIHNDLYLASYRRQYIDLEAQILAPIIAKMFGIGMDKDFFVSKLTPPNLHLYDFLFHLFPPQLAIKESFFPIFNIYYMGISNFLVCERPCKNKSQFYFFDNNQTGSEFNDLNYFNEGKYQHIINGMSECDPKHRDIKVLANFFIIQFNYI